MKSLKYNCLAPVIESGLASSMGFGMSLPEGSTGMSSYLSKLMPVLGPLNSSLGKERGEGGLNDTRRRRHSVTHFSSLSLGGNNTFQSTLRDGLASPSSLLSPPHRG